jgi:hypothetical protein
MKLLFLPLLGLGLIGCGGPPPEIMSFTVEPSMAARGADVTIAIVVANFELREPEPETGHALRPFHDSGEGEGGDYPDGGHFHVYLDTTESNPMFINCPDYCEHGASVSPVRARIPDDASIGEHTVIARLNDDQHKFLKPEIRATTTLTIAN